MTLLKTVKVAVALMAGATLLALAQSGPVGARSYNGGMASPHAATTCGSDLISCCCYTQHGAAFCAREGSCFNRGGTCAVTGC